MRPTKTIKLSRTYAIHGKAITEIGLKEPTWDDYAELGELFEIQASPAGTKVVIENREALKGYIERCIDGIQPAELGLLGLEDARALREGMFGFFARSASPPLPETPSSSTSDGVPATSAP